MIIITPLEAVIDYDNLITTGGTIILGALSVFSGIQIALINSGRQHLKAVRRQTENDHGDNGSNNDSEVNKKIPNLRENIDHNQDRLIEKLDSILDTQRRQGNKLDRLFSITSRHSTQIEDIENTQTGKINHE